MEDNNNSKQTPANPNPANTGNASNPSPNNEQFTPAGGNQLLDEKAEKYIRESGNIEDMPDAEEEERNNEQGTRNLEQGSEGNK